MRQTLEMRFWGEKQKNGCALDQPRPLLLSASIVEDGLICAEASLALAEEVDIPPLSCDVANHERVQDGKATQRADRKTPLNDLRG